MRERKRESKEQKEIERFRKTNFGILSKNENFDQPILKTKFSSRYFVTIDYHGRSAIAIHRRCRSARYSQS